MRKARFWEYVLGTPWLLATIIIVLLTAGAFWLWSEINESKEAEKNKSADKKRGDSIWDD